MSRQPRGRSTPLRAIEVPPALHASDKTERPSGGPPRWRSIVLGTYASCDALRAALHAAGMEIGDLAEAALDQLDLPRPGGATEIDLVAQTGIELGITAENTTLGEIVERAGRVGLALCPAEVGPQLRLQYRNQRPGEFLRIAMAPIATARAEVGFTVGNGGAGLLLIGGDGRLEAPVASILRYVFVSPRTAA
jgi:hypothetical protein